jgi:RNA-directed DNA polymerase
MSLATPSKIRELQIKLYRKAKDEPGYRFYMLFDKIYREDILAHAYALARANKGAPGVDGQTFDQIESAGREEWLTGIRQELRNKTYQPQPVRRVMIPKRKRHQVHSRGTNRFSVKAVFGELGVLQLRRVRMEPRS